MTANHIDLNTAAKVLAFAFPEQLIMSQEPTIEYMFIRAEGFYFVQLPSDHTPEQAARMNPGTLKIVRVPEGETVWTHQGAN